MNLSEINKKLELLETAKRWGESEGRALECAKYHLNRAIIYTIDDYKRKQKLVESLEYIAVRCKANKYLNAKKAGVKFTMSKKFKELLN